MSKAALISVSDRTGLAPFAKDISAAGYTILCTSGTGAYLKESGLETLSIEEYTGQKEILGGRVKTLHPKIHAGLLAKREDPEHLKQLEDDGIFQIDIAVVNLYPFLEKVKGEAGNDPEKMIEFIDIGGPTMIRAAAKNCKAIYAVIDPDDYPAVSQSLQSDDIDLANSLRLSLAGKVFARLAHYNLEIAKYFSHVSAEGGKLDIDASTNYRFGRYEGGVLKQKQSLRYGENPHQQAVLYENIGEQPASWQQHQGKELSYNNLLDFDAAFRMLPALGTESAGVLIIKHLNPCGAALSDSLTEALENAKRCDPRSHFGGIIAFNREVDPKTASEITKDFTEIVLAPGYTEDALDQLSKKKNLRVLSVDLKQAEALEQRTIQGGVLLQSVDTGSSSVMEAECVTSRVPTEEEYVQLQLAWNLCAHVKSNAITIVRDKMLIAAGGGQMSRIDALEVALMKAETHDHDLAGAVAASDAFFPFYDCVEQLAEKGVTVVVAPSGSKADGDVTKRAEELGISLLFVKDRHFRH